MREVRFVGQSAFPKETGFAKLGVGVEIQACFLPALHSAVHVLKYKGRNKSNPRAGLDAAGVGRIATEGAARVVIGSVIRPEIVACPNNQGMGRGKSRRGSERRGMPGPCVSAGAGAPRR